MALKINHDCTSKEVFMLIKREFDKQSKSYLEMQKPRMKQLSIYDIFESTRLSENTRRGIRWI